MPATMFPKILSKEAREKCKKEGSREDLVYDANEVVNVNWYTKEEILNKIKDGKVNKGYAYILEKYN